MASPCSREYSLIRSSHSEQGAEPVFGIGLTFGLLL